ncbi:unnamed protein product, partial [Prorocentrum cordatum]
ASDLELDGVAVGQIVRAVSKLRAGQPASPPKEPWPVVEAAQPQEGGDVPRPEGLAAAAARPAPAEQAPAATAQEAAQASSRGPVGPDDVELVVASYCEDTKWFTAYPGPVTVYSKKHECTGALRAAVAGSLSSRGRVVELPNLGREGQSYVRHMLLNWDNLTLYTAFAQGAGRHNNIKSLDATLRFLKSQEVPGAPQPLISTVLLCATEPRCRASWIVPMVARSADGWKLYRDKDEPPHEVVAGPGAAPGPAGG